MRLQRQVIRLALAAPVDVRALGEAMDVEYATRRQYQLGANAHPAAVNLLTRATDEGLPMPLIVWLLDRGRVSIDATGRIEYRPPRWRRALLLVLLVGFLAWLCLLSALALRASSASLVDFAILVAVAAAVVGYFARLIHAAIKDEVDVIERLKEVRSVRSTSPASGHGTK